MIRTGSGMATLALLVASCARAPAPVAEATPTGQAEAAAPGGEAGDPVGSEILWDTWGVPHVYGASVEELGRGFGWAQMHLHADAILTQYGLARGRGAEYWGERYLEADRLVRTLGIPRAGDEALASQPDEFRRYLEAFAEGMTAYARAHPEAIGAESRGVLPVEAADPLRHAFRAVLAFASATGGRPAPMGLDGFPRGLSGSNTWAIGPARSASGNALLLQNPHLPWTMPILRFTEAHLIGPGIDVYGVTFIGLPVIAIGFNRHLGWSHTVNTIDVLDTYRIVSEDDGYRFDGQVRPFETSTEVIAVLEKDGGQRPDTLRVRRTVHGPVVRLDDTLQLAVRTPALERHGSFLQWWDMGRARGLEEFEAAVRRMQIPLFTISYADRAGRIYYLYNGSVPVRPFGDFEAWQRPARGDTSATLWTGVHPYEDLPRLVDPESGFLQNSNSPPWLATVPSPLRSADFPPYLAPNWMLMRELRALEMLTEARSIGFEDLVAMRHSSRFLLADRVLDDLVAAARAAGGELAGRAADVLAAWDREATPASRGAVLFLQWAARACRGGPEDPCGFARPWDPADPLRTPHGLADPARAAAVLVAVAEAMEDGSGGLDVPWGAVMRLDPAVVGGAGAAADHPGRGAPGDPFGVFHVVGYAAPPEAGPFRAAGGDTWVAALEFTPDGPRAMVILAYGNSTQAGSPHAGDQLGMLSRGEMRAPWLTRAEIEANLADRTRIAP